MSNASSPVPPTRILAPSPPTRILALSLPRLSSDRLRRERLGRRWRCAAPPEDAATVAGGETLRFAQAPGSAHRANAPLLGASTPLHAVGALRPLALYEKAEGALRLVALCEGAQALGLSPGLGLAEARARFPFLDLAEADPGADRRLICAVADWCDRYTPLVATDGESRLLLDISGCAHLFGGEAVMMAGLLARLHREGLSARAAIAPAIGTARALVDHAPGACIEPGGEQAALAPLPAAALRLDAGETAMLARLGLKTIGDLLALPRAGLARRFGPGLPDRLEEALGRRAVPFSPRRPVPLLLCERRLAEPISREEDVLALAAALAGRLAADLERRGEGARRLCLALFRVDGAVERIGLRTAAPTRDPARIARLFAERLKGRGEELDAGFGYDLVRLCVEAADPMAERQGDLARPARGGEEIEALIDRLAARLGETALACLAGVESHRPERAQRAVAPAGRLAPAFSAATAPSGPPLALRPVRLLERPEPVEATAEVPEGAPALFRWRRALHKVRKVEGPERVAPEWWRGEDGGTRDYFSVEDEAGRRFWLYREGRYGEDRPAHWYMHGLFA